MKRHKKRQPAALLVLRTDSKSRHLEAPWPGEISNAEVRRLQMIAAVPTPTDSTDSSGAIDEASSVANRIKYTLAPARPYSAPTPPYMPSAPPLSLPSPSHSSAPTWGTSIDAGLSTQSDKRTAAFAWTWMNSEGGPQVGVAPRGQCADPAHHSAALARVVSASVPSARSLQGAPPVQSSSAPATRIVHDLLSYSSSSSASESSGGSRSNGATAPTSANAAHRARSLPPWTRSKAASVVASQVSPVQNGGNGTDTATSAATTSAFSPEEDEWMLCEYRACRAEGSNRRAQCSELAKFLRGRSAADIRHRVCVLLLAERAADVGSEDRVSCGSTETTSAQSGSPCSSDWRDSDGVRRNQVVPSFACISPVSSPQCSKSRDASSVADAAKKPGNAGKESQVPVHSAPPPQREQNESVTASQESLAVRRGNAGAAHGAPIFVDLTSTKESFQVLNGLLDVKTDALSPEDLQEIRNLIDTKALKASSALPDTPITPVQSVQAVKKKPLQPVTPATPRGISTAGVNPARSQKKKVTLRTDHKGDKYTDADREVIKEALPRWQEADERGKQSLCREVALELKRTVGGIQRRLRQQELAAQQHQQHQQHHEHLPTASSTKKRTAAQMESPTAAGERPRRLRKRTQFFRDAVDDLSEVEFIGSVSRKAPAYTAEEEALIAQACDAISSGADQRQTQEDLCARLGRSRGAIRQKLRETARKQGACALSTGQADADVRSQSSTAGSESNSADASASASASSSSSAHGSTIGDGGSEAGDAESGSAGYASAVSDAGDAGQNAARGAVSEAGNAGEDDRQNAGQHSDHTALVHCESAAAAESTGQERAPLWPVTVEDLQRMDSHLAQRPSPQQAQADASSARQDQPEEEC